ncbi:MAG: TRL-like family protein [Myxococcota bacterium]|nr:TRL-like family protein [Myxococcota bacterium]
MNKLAALTVGLLLSLGTVGCIAAPVVPPLGLIYTNIEAPINPTGGNPSGRRGESSVVAILALFSTGDGSVRAAAQNGGITNVEHIDYEFYNVLGIYQRYTTVVYGN